MSAVFKADPFVELDSLEGEPVRAGAALAIRASSFASGGAGTRPGVRGLVVGTGEAERPSTRVLVIEPDASARSVLEVSLAREGFLVLSAASAEDALRQLAPGRPLPTVIVAESQLGGEDGFSFCTRIRADARTAELPVILLAKADDGYGAELASGSGADDYLPKPIFAKDVASLIRLNAAARSEVGAHLLDTHELPLAHLLRALLAGVRAGRIEALGGRVRIAFRRGQVIDARFDSLDGSAALHRALLLAEGEYTVSFGPAFGRATFTYGLLELVSSAFPRLIRWQKLRTASVPLEARLEVDFKQLATQLDSMPDRVNEVVRLFDGRRTVRDVLIDSNLEEGTALEVATRLYTMAVIVPAPELPAEADVLPAQAKIFEPAPLAAVEQMKELFGDALPTVADAAMAEDADWTSELRPAPMPAVDPQEGWTAAPVTELAPEIQAQLDAFNIQPVIEPRQAPAPAPEVASFLRGESNEPGASVERPIQLTHVASAEDHFFKEEEAPVAAPAPAAVAKKPVGSTASVLIAVGMLVAGGALVAGITGLSSNAEAPKPAPVVEAPPPAPVVAAPAPAPEPEESADALADAAQLNEAIAAYDSGDPKKAADLLTTFVAKTPGNARAWLFLGLADYDLGLVEKAKTEGEKVLSIDAENGRALMLMASIHLEQGDKDKANAELKKYLDLNPDGPLADDAKKLLAK